MQDKNYSDLIDKGWNDMRGILEQEMPSKRKPIFIWMLIGLTIIIAGFAALQINNWSNNGNLLQAQESVIENREVTSDNSIDEQNDHPKPDFESKQKSTANQLITKNVQILDRQNDGNVQKENTGKTAILNSKNRPAEKTENEKLLVLKDSNKKLTDNLPIITNNKVVAIRKDNQYYKSINLIPRLTLLPITGIKHLKEFPVLDIDLKQTSKSYFNPSFVLQGFGSMNGKILGSGVYAINSFKIGTRTYINLGAGLEVERLGIALSRTESDLSTGLEDTSGSDPVVSNPTDPNSILDVSNVSTVKYVEDNLVSTVKFSVPLEYTYRILPKHSIGASAFYTYLIKASNNQSLDRSEFLSNSFLSELGSNSFYSEGLLNKHQIRIGAFYEYKLNTLIQFRTGISNNAFSRIKGSTYKDPLNSKYLLIGLRIAL